MVRASNGIVCVLNFIYLLVSIPIISAGFWFKSASSNDCQRYLQWPMIILGLSILILCLLGIFGSCCRVNFFLWIYLFLMYLLILAMFVVTVFVIVVTNSKMEEEVSKMEVLDYRVGNYSNWLERTVTSEKNWAKLEGCLKQSDVCDDTNNENPNFFVFSEAGKNLQLGCCKPPPSCGYTMVNATYWEPPKSMTADSDCKQWSNGKDEMCYACDTCKGAVLLGLKGDWKKIAIFNSVILLLLVMMYSVGCCAFRNNRNDRHRHNYYRGYH